MQVDVDEAQSARLWAERQVNEAVCLGWLNALREAIAAVDRRFHGERCEARRKANNLN
jgi:hypothetical protein